MRKLVYAMSMLLTVALVWTGCSEPTPEPVEKFTVTFNSQGGSDVSSLTINKGAKITEPAKPTKGDLIFVDWFKEATYVNVWNFSTDVVTADITLYAKWTTVEYTVTFNTTGGSAIEAVKVAKGATFRAPLPPSKADLAFNCWFKEAALTTEWNFSSDVVTADITLYAKWSEITREALEELTNTIYNLDSDNYTRESYYDMIEKRDAALTVLENDESTLAQIITAYKELQAAINALVALPVKEPAAIDVYVDIIDGFIYVRPGEIFRFSAYAVDAVENNATDSRVTFTYDEAKLATWAENIFVDIHNIQFLAKPVLTAGETIDITIASAAKPAIFTTITLKIPAVGELKAKFIETVNALPEPDKISYDDYEAIDKAWDIHEALTDEERQDAAVKTAIDRLRKCSETMEDLPYRLNYSFNGNVCTLTMSDFGENITMKADFVAAGAFPQGTYTDQLWRGDDDDYDQLRIVLGSDGQGSDFYRYSENANGSDPTEWEVWNAFTYTVTGTKATGGTFFITYLK